MDENHKIMLELDAEKAEKLKSMLDVHVRPIYFKVSEGAESPEWGAQQLSLCDEISDQLSDALNQGKAKN